MKEILTKEEYYNFIRGHPAVLLYFSTLKCNVCKVLKPKLNLFIEKNFSKIITRFINTEYLPDIAAQNSIFTVPTIIIFFDGKEFIRVSRNFSFDEFHEKISRPYTMFFDS